MQKVVYNIIWADDEVHQLMREELKQKFLADNHINVIAAVTTGDEFRLKFEELKHQIDAVITDANFNKQESLPMAIETCPASPLSVRFSILRLHPGEKYHFSSILVEVSLSPRNIQMENWTISLKRTEYLRKISSNNSANVFQEMWMQSILRLIGFVKNTEWL